MNAVIKQSSRWLGAGAFAILGACAVQAPSPSPEPPRPPAEEPPPVEERAAPVVVGAILSETGPGALRQYAELVGQGIEIAFREQAQSGGREVELVVLDDGGQPDRAAQLVAELESRGAVAIIGPLLNASLEAAGRARSDPSLAIISPTSSAHPTRLANAYTLNAEDTRGAEALGAYVAQRDNGRVGVLFPDAAAFRAQAEAFQSAAESAGTSIAAAVPFVPGTTTFSAPLERLRAAAVQAIFIPAAERDIRQLAPQLEYYGLGGIEVLGLEAWVSDEVLHFLPGRVLEGVVAATPLYRSSQSVAWDEFVGLYEAAYRRSLDNPYPALGYDAARLVLANLPQGSVRPEDVASGVAGTDEFRGATGVLSARDGYISRKPFIVRIQSGRPVLERQ